VLARVYGGFEDSADCYRVGDHQAVSGCTASMTMNEGVSPRRRMPAGPRSAPWRCRAHSAVTSATAVRTADSSITVLSTRTRRSSGGGAAPWAIENTTSNSQQ